MCTKDFQNFNALESIYVYMLGGSVNIFAGVFFFYSSEYDKAGYVNCFWGLSFTESRQLKYGYMHSHVMWGSNERFLRKLTVKSQFRIKCYFLEVYARNGIMICVCVCALFYVWLCMCVCECMCICVQCCLSNFSWFSSNCYANEVVLIWF